LFRRSKLDIEAGKILIVDNELQSAVTIKIALDSDGMRSDAFNDPQKALEQFKLRPDDYLLILSDIRMPAMSGFEFVRQIRKIRPEASVILMTAFEIDTSEFVKVFPSTKVDGFIQKPFSMDALNEVIFWHARQGVD